MKTTIYEIVNNGNRYCGPAVIAALTGLGTKEAAAILRERSGRRSIMGTSTSLIYGTLQALGFTLKSVMGERLNLRQWSRKYAKGNDVYLVSAGWHWILVQGKYAICGQTKNLVHVDDHPYARAFVKDAVKLNKVSNVDPESLLTRYLAEEKQKQHANTIAAKTRRLAKEYGIEAEKERGMCSIGVFPPCGLFLTVDDEEENDPYYGDHYVDSWSEAYERVEEYVKIINSRRK